MAAPILGAAVPRRATGVVPVGPLQDGGFVEQPWLVRRGDRFLQVSELLYRVLALIDGQRTLEQIAGELTRTSAWDVSERDVATVIERKLAPLGLAGTTDAPPVTPSAPPAPMLHANVRLRVIGPAAIDSVARVAQHLFRPAVLAVALVVVALGHGWLFLAGDPGEAMQEITTRPLAIPLLVGVLSVAGAIHEFGHAAALRYGGARARGMGVGWYLVFPIFYTDVTESYRLSRRARIRTDLGGLYFHLLAAVALLIGYAITGDELLLVAVLIIDLDVARQLIPFIRLDGYWLLSDLTGIPDLFTHAAPRLLRRFGLRHDGPAPPPLRPAVRRIFGGYMLVTIPVIIALFAYVAWHAPTAAANAVTAIDQRAEIFAAAVRDGHIGIALAALSEMLLFVLPALAVVGVAIVVGRVGWALARRRSSGHDGISADPAVREPAGPARERISLGDAIAEHLELKRRHALEDGVQIQSAGAPFSSSVERIRAPGAYATTG